MRLTLTRWVVVIGLATIGVVGIHAVAAQQGRQAQAPAPQALSTGVSVAPDAYRLGPGDVLDISVWHSADLSKTVPVRPDGMISLPLLNDIQAASLTPMQLRDQLEKKYAAYVSEPEVSVIVREINSLTVSVVGMVKTPGRYPLNSQTTVLEALALAGGLTDFAKKDRIVIFRRSGRTWRTIPFNYAHIVNDWSADENVALEPGDIVVVP